MAGNTAAYRDWTATIQVASLAPILAALKAAGGEVVTGCGSTLNGARLIARHPDGAIRDRRRQMRASLVAVRACKRDRGRA